MASSRVGPVAALVLCAAVIPGCGGSGGGSVEGPVTVYVSLPLSGPRGPDGNDAADGARLALERAGGKAGGLAVRAEILDDARGKPWDPVAVGENARAAAQDSSAAAYIGELDSEPTRASAPITNQAGIAQVSPGAPAVDLTGPAQGYPDSPGRYRPSGSPSFARVAPSDSVALAAAAGWAAELDLRRILVELGDSAFAKLSATEFAARAAEVGIEVVDSAPQADAALVEAGFEGFGLSAAVDRELSVWLAPSGLVGRRFVAEFTERFGRSPSPASAYGYEAMRVVLEAIDEAEGAGDFRAAVVGAALDSEHPDSVLGRYSITEEGDTTLCTIQRYELRDGERESRGAPCPQA